MRLSYPDSELTDGVLRLRRWEMADLECIRAAGQDPRITSDTSVPPIYSQQQGRAFVERQWRRLEDGVGIALAVAIAETDEAVGHVYLAVRPQSLVLGLGYWVIPESRGRGFAARAARMATTWALTSLGAERVEAWVRPDNEPSLRTIASAGFQREGVLRSFLAFAEGRSDMVVWARLPTDHASPARPDLDGDAQLGHGNADGGLRSVSVPVLLISGSAGSGKSTIAAEINDLLAEREIPNAAVDLDALVWQWPSTSAWNSDLCFKNLGALWTNYYAHGAQRLVLARVLEDPSDLDRYRTVIPGAEIVVCRLSTTQLLRERRLRERMPPGPSLDWHLDRTTELEAILEQRALEDFVVDNGERRVREVAVDVLVRAGWLSRST